MNGLIKLLQNKMIQALLLKSVRAGIMGLGGLVLAKGLATSSQATDLEGSLIFLASYGFSLFDAFVVKKQVAVAAATGAIPASVSVLQPTAPPLAAAAVPPAGTMAPIPNPPGT